MRRVTGAGQQLPGVATDVAFNTTTFWACDRMGVTLCLNATETPREPTESLPLGNNVRPQLKSLIQDR
jgi:hypothetical protein